MFESIAGKPEIHHNDSKGLHLVQPVHEENPGAEPAIGPDPLRLSIVIPAFNEAKRMPKLFRELEKFLDLDTTEIIVVDDGSADETGSVAQCFIDSIPHGQVVRLSSNSGKGCAVREGVSRTTGEFVMFMDADGATDLTCIEELVTSLDHCDIAIGSRSHSDATVARSHRYRAHMGRAFNLVVRSVAGLPYRDTQCGFKAFRGGVARLLFSVSSVNGFAFDVEILRLARQLGFSTTEIPVIWTHQSGSKIQHLADPTRMVFDTARIRVRRSALTIQTIQIATSESSEALASLAEQHPALLFSIGRDYIDIVVGSEAPLCREGVITCIEANGLTHREMIQDLDALRIIPYAHLLFTSN
jgi:hypothetical protein